MGKIKTVEDIKNQSETVLVERRGSMEFLKGLLNNIAVLKWVRRNSADNLKDDVENFNKLGITTRDDSVAIMDSTNVKCLITNAIYKGEKHAMFSLEQLAEIIADVGTEGRLIIGQKDNPCFIEDDK